MNDKGGSPIEIAAVIVWLVKDTAHAMFDVDDYELFVRVQAESAVRVLASKYHYDQADDGDGSEDLSLRGAREEISHELRGQLEERLERAGIEVVEARLSHLAYAPEIAGAMLRRQQADAVIAARKKIVEGAVSMVQMALDDLSRGEDRGAGRGTPGRHGQQSHGGALLGAGRAAGGEHRNAVHVATTRSDHFNHFAGIRTHGATKTVSDSPSSGSSSRSSRPGAEQELRSLNAQIEFVLRQAVDRRRGKKTNQDR